MNTTITTTTDDLLDTNWLRPEHNGPDGAVFFREVPGSGGRAYQAVLATRTQTAGFVFTAPSQDAYAIAGFIRGWGTCARDISLGNCAPWHEGDVKVRLELALADANADAERWLVLNRR